MRTLSPTPRTASRSSRRRWFGVILLAVALTLLAGCAETGQMVYQPRYNTMEESAFFSDGKSARTIPDGTVPFTGQGTANDPINTGVNAAGEPYTGYPVQVDQDLIAEGQERFQIYCTPCHGATGEGNGQAVTFRFPKPPTLIGPDANDLSNGQIFAIITNGQGLMFPYGYRVKAEERWAVIAYIRALKLKEGQVNVEELTPEEISEIGGQQ